MPTAGQSTQQHNHLRAHKQESFSLLLSTAYLSLLKACARFCNCSFSAFNACLVKSLVVSWCRNSPAPREKLLQHGSVDTERRLIDPCCQTPDKGEISNKTSLSDHDTHQRYDIRNTPTHSERGTKNPYKDEAPKETEITPATLLFFLLLITNPPAVLLSLHLTIA